MTIPTIKTGGWPTNGSLTSSELNAFQTAVARALDKTAAGDTLTGAIQLSGAGRIIPSVATGPNLDSTIAVGSSNGAVQVTSSVTANRTYTLSNSGAVTGDIISMYCDSTFLYAITVKDASNNTLFEIGNSDSNDGTWASFIYMGGWKVYQQAQGSRQRSVDFTDSGTWTCPRGVKNIMVYAFGGGGAGGAGGTAYGFQSGAGGGGSLASWANIQVTPGTVYSVSIGAGGASNGAWGSETSFAVQSGSILARWTGALGGASAPVTSTSNLAATPGMPYVYWDQYQSSSISPTDFAAGFTAVPGAGGRGGYTDGTYVYSGTAGSWNLGNLPGGHAGGAAGAGSLGFYAGGGGGGGGPGGPGGSGGNYPGAGSAAAKNSGAGGGGGSQSTVVQAGGAGGSGRLTLYFVK